MLLVALRGHDFRNTDLNNLLTLIDKAPPTDISRAHFFLIDQPFQTLGSPAFFGYGLVAKPCILHKYLFVLQYLLHNKREISSWDIVCAEVKKRSHYNTILFMSYALTALGVCGRFDAQGFVVVRTTHPWLSAHLVAVRSLA